MNLSELAININEAFDRSKKLYADGIDYLKLALLTDKEVGEMLLEVKLSVPHGSFTSWIQDNCQFSDRHARRLMTIARDWTKIMKVWENMKSDTRVRFGGDPLPSLRIAIALASAEPKPETPPSPPVIKYKVALPSHPCYGETVEVKEELSKGDVILCKTSKGEIPFLKKELVSESVPLEQVDAEIIDVEVEDISEQLKGAIALVIEYLPETELKAVLAASLSIGKDHLPSDAQGIAARLIGGQDLAILSQA
ncbi:DUF3102 domain-containing protein [uncultured Nostoc sp.]|uniref:DUF3102 domain-containing protein n=1 Tax=uncultured Nostoc sp. TaxID=340711 RepID=UPI0035CC5928